MYLAGVSIFSMPEGHLKTRRSPLVVGGVLVLTLAVQAQSTFTGKKNIYMLAQDNDAQTKWTYEGLWTP